MAPRVLLIDDDEDAVQGLALLLQREGFTVWTALQGQAGLDLALKARPDVIVLDVMMPELDGFEVCRRLRQERVGSGIIMLTARSDDIDRILGLEIGADDYVVKPCNPRELLARIKALLRRIGARPDQEHIKVIGPWSIDLAGVKVFQGTQEVPLTTREFQLLAYLAVHANQVLSREQLLNGIWGYEFVGATRMVDVHMRNLRAKLEADPANPQYLQTVRGLGYVLRDER